MHTAFEHSQPGIYIAADGAMPRRPVFVCLTKPNGSYLGLVSRVQVLPPARSVWRSPPDATPRLHLATPRLHLAAARGFVRLHLAAAGVFAVGGLEVGM